MEENGQKNVVDNVENMEQSQSENEEELKEDVGWGIFFDR